MAERVVDLVTSRLADQGRGPYRECGTERLTLSGGQVGGSAGFEAFVRESVRAGTNAGLTAETAEWLARRYGSNAAELYELHRVRGGEAREFGLPPRTFLTLLYAMEEEMAVTPADYFIRRTGALYFDIEEVRRTLGPVTRYMAAHYGWSEEIQEERMAEMKRRLEEAVTPVDG
ncbi:glycerol-3-phosphate dehydrogenase/oxidase [Paenibacillus sp. CC-CFT747]|nr:glycerol-3-phosphate dehydrogenase/oxidase [Paenibacillus sp. CC-CFT747]